MNKNNAFLSFNTIIDKRYLFSNENLRIDKYIVTNNKIEVQFADMNSLYITFLIFN